ncbi:hypothetical protein OSTOST_09933 [Ostertagia ostertagi]
MSDVETPTELLQGLCCNRQVVIPLPLRHSVWNLKMKASRVCFFLPAPVQRILGNATHAGNVSRRPRQRPRAGPGGARGKGKPEENSEEMQRQINEIVQAALKVDSAAKEKERRSRGAERPARRSGAMSGSIDSVVVPLQRSTPFAISSRRDEVEVETVSTPVSTSSSQMAFTSITPSTVLVQKVNAHMDICSNELTTPFKIPHKDKEKGKASPAVATRSPLADAHDTREFSQRDIQTIKMRQKKRYAAEHAREAKKARKQPETSITQDPLAVVDRICGEMAASRGRREQKREVEERTPQVVNHDATLSREALERHALDDTMAREVDPPPESAVPRTDMEMDYGGMSAPRRGPRTPPLADAPAVATVETPQRPKQQRGPKTPPGSPGPRTPPPIQPSQPLQPSVPTSTAPTMQSLLANIAAMAGTSTSQLASTLGEDLNRMVGSVNTGVLLESFVSALRTATAQQPSTTNDQEKASQSAALKREASSKSLSRREIDTDSVKMELVSDCSLSPLQADSPSRANSPLQAPPPPPIIAPPPPPPILPPPPISVAAPPPPPSHHVPMVSFIPMAPPNLPVPNLAVPPQPPLLPPPFPLIPNFAALPPPIPIFAAPVAGPTVAAHVATSSASTAPTNGAPPPSQHTMMPPSNMNGMTNIPNLTMPPPSISVQTTISNLSTRVNPPASSQPSNLPPSFAGSVGGTPQKVSSEGATRSNQQNFSPPKNPLFGEGSNADRCNANATKPNDPTNSDPRPNSDRWRSKDRTEGPRGSGADDSTGNKTNARFDPKKRQKSADNTFAKGQRGMNLRKKYERGQYRGGPSRPQNAKPDTSCLPTSLAPLPSELQQEAKRKQPEMPTQEDSEATSRKVTSTLLSALGIGSSSSASKPQQQTPSKPQHTPSQAQHPSPQVQHPPPKPQRQQSPHPPDRKMSVDRFNNDRRPFPDNRPFQQNRGKSGRPYRPRD